MQIAIICTQFPEQGCILPLIPACDIKVDTKPRAGVLEPRHGPFRPLLVASSLPTSLVGVCLSAFPSKSYLACYSRYLQKPHWVNVMLGPKGLGTWNFQQLDVLHTLNKKRVLLHISVCWILNCRLTSTSLINPNHSNSLFKIAFQRPLHIELSFNITNRDVVPKLWQSTFALSHHGLRQSKLLPNLPETGYRNSHVLQILWYESTAVLCDMRCSLWQHSEQSWYVLIMLLITLTLRSYLPFLASPSYSNNSYSSENADSDGGYATDLSSPILSPSPSPSPSPTPSERARLQCQYCDLWFEDESGRDEHLEENDSGCDEHRECFPHGQNYTHARERWHNKCFVPGCDNDQEMDNEEISEHIWNQHILRE